MRIESSHKAIAKSVCISGGVDFLAFAVLYLALKKRAMLAAFCVAGICARVISAPIAYHIKKKELYPKSSNKSAFRYTAVSLIKLAIVLINIGFAEKRGINAVLVVKPVSDAVIAAAAFPCEKKWVFAPSERKEFFAPFGRFARVVAKVLGFRCKVIESNEEYGDKAVMYVCRHANLRGPIAALASFEEDVHPMVIGSFFTKEDAYKHLSNFTFGKRFDLPEFIAKPMAAISSAVVAPFMRSIQAVPVYRDHRAITSLRIACKYLEEDESVVVFPDIAYTEQSGDGDIYSGFITIGALYKKKTGKNLRFVPLAYNGRKKQITVMPSLVWENEKMSREEAADYLRSAIHS